MPGRALPARQGPLHTAAKPIEWSAHSSTALQLAEGLPVA